MSWQVKYFTSIPSTLFALDAIFISHFLVYFVTEWINESLQWLYTRCILNEIYLNSNERKHLKQIKHCVYESIFRTCYRIMLCIKQYKDQMINEYIYHLTDQAQIRKRLLKFTGHCICMPPYEPTGRFIIFV